MSKLKTPEELAKKILPDDEVWYEEDSLVGDMPHPPTVRRSSASSSVDMKRKGCAAGISYTREHEVKPLVEVLLMVAKSDSFVRINGAAQKAVNEALTLYTNEVK